MPTMTMEPPTGPPPARRDPPMLAGERETLTGFLDYQRATLLWNARG